MMLRFFPSLVGISCLCRAATAQSTLDDSSEYASSTCTSRTGIYQIYTSDSSTYFVQDPSRTGLAASSCPTDATSTVFAVSTFYHTDQVSTVYRSSTYYVSNLSTISCGPSGNNTAYATSSRCPPPTTILVPAPTSGTGFEGFTHTSTSIVFQTNGSCPLDCTAPATVTSLSPAEPCPSCPSQTVSVSTLWDPTGLTSLLPGFTTTVYQSNPTGAPDPEYSSWLSNGSPSCSSIANISAVVTSSISGSLVSSVIYGTGYCPVYAQRSGAQLTSGSGLSGSLSTVYESASCQTLRALPPVTTSIYLSNADCSQSTVYSTVFQNGSSGTLPAVTLYANSSCPSGPSGVLTVTNAGAVTTLFTDGASCTAAANASTITLSQSFVSTVFTQDPMCNYRNTSMDMDSIISATRYTTVYGPDVTVTMPGSSVIVASPGASGEMCSDECYVDFDDDGIPDIQESGSSVSSAPPANATSTAAPVVVADHGFENGTAIPLNSSSSSPAVTAQIAQKNDSTPLTPQNGDSFLYEIFFSENPFSLLTCVIQVPYV